MKVVVVVLARKLLSPLPKNQCCPVTTFDQTCERTTLKMHCNPIYATAGLHISLVQGWKVCSPAFVAVKQTGHAFAWAGNEFMVL